MKAFSLVTILFFAGVLTHRSHTPVTGPADTTRFPHELVDFSSLNKRKVFDGTGTDTWDSRIRERGWILKEGGVYYLWYTGYRKDDSEEKHLGYATSPDGLNWKRFGDNPIYDKGWVEDMCIVKSGNTYFMFAEGRGDTAHMMVSTDRVHWTEKGPLDIRLVDGRPISPGSYGTPAAWLEKGIWYLFYERGDLGIWLATSSDGKVWKNKQDEPVLMMGPEEYDQYGLAVDQIIQYKGMYYAYYHATGFRDWHEWTSNIARSKDLLHWEKYSGNPIMRDNRSSPIIINDGNQILLYTMHPGVEVHYPKK